MRGSLLAVEMCNGFPTALPSGEVLAAEARDSWQKPLLSHSSL